MLLPVRTKHIVFPSWPDCRTAELNGSMNKPRRVRNRQKRAGPHVIPQPPENQFGLFVTFVNWSNEGLRASWA